ncbi:MAG: hypothetical protein AAFR24_08420 [Cyanobacteria bacterium J06627_3]
MLGKLLGKGKKSGYYLELSEDEIAAIPEPSVKPTPQAPVAKVESTPATSKTVSAEPAAAEPAAPPQATVPAVSAAVSKAAAAIPQEVAVPEPMSDPLELIRTALAAAANQASETESKSTPTFAEYSAPLAKARRRRPGPSMSPFKSMAKDMRKTNSGF